AIKTNQDLLPETPWVNIFYDDFWGTLLTHSGSHKSYRPLCTLSFRLNHFVGGLEPWSYHLVNVAFHGAVTGLFTVLARLLLGGGPWSLLAGLLFASHPIHTEAVAGVVGRADEGAALFFLLSLLCYIRHCNLRGHAARGWPVAWFLCSLACAAGSMLWKELGVTVLAVSALYDTCVFHRLKIRQVLTLLYKRCRGKISEPRKHLQPLLNVSLLALWGVVLLACRFYWMGNKPPNFSNSDNPAADSPSLLTRTLTFFYLPAVNFWLLLCPDMLSFDWSMDALPLIRTIADRRNCYTVAFYLGLLSLACFSLWRTLLPTTEHVVVFSLGLLAIPFLPATNLFFYVGFVIAERVLYIPSMGFCLLVAVGMRSLYVRLRRRSSRAVLAYCAAVLVLLFSIKTVLRNRDWQNEEMLYKSGIYVNPAKNQTAWGNLGNVLKSQESNKFSEALHYYKLAIGSRPTLASAYLNTGIILMNQGRTDEAKRTFV
uniref:Transmembrane O-mannosyltransferase targeting cadherins 2 n=1 Tax=Tetraodon nigroviridis TaxID=99883 RepID=H3CTQ1_TETNG